MAQPTQATVYRGSAIPWRLIFLVVALVAFVAAVLVILFMHGPNALKYTLALGWGGSAAFVLAHF